MGESRRTSLQAKFDSVGGEIDIRFCLSYLMPRCLMPYVLCLMFYALCFRIFAFRVRVYALGVRL